MIRWLACVRSARADLLGARSARIGMRSARGLTLVELLVTIAIAAILLAIGIPSLQSFITTNVLATAANDLIAALNLARGEAVRCGSNIDVTFVYGAGNGTNTGASWNVYSCTNPGVPIRSGVFSDPQLALSGTTPAAGKLTFDSQGRLFGAVTGNAYGLIVCRGGELNSGALSTSRAVLVAATGRIKVAPTNATSYVPMETATVPVPSCNGL